MEPKGFSVRKWDRYRLLFGLVWLVLVSSFIRMLRKVGVATSNRLTKLCLLLVMLATLPISRMDTATLVGVTIGLTFLRLLQR